MTSVQANDYFYASKKNHKVMQKYQEFFNSVFTQEVVAFGYMRWSKNGDFVDLESSLPMQELFLETQAYEDSPIITNYKHVNPGSTFRYYNQDIENPKSNSTRALLEDKFNVSHAFSITEKHNDYCELIIWDFLQLPNKTTMLEYQNSVLQDCINHSKRIEACFKQLKEELFSPTNNKDLYRVNLKDIKGESYNTQKHIVDKSKNTIKEGLLKAGIIEPKDLRLQNIKFTQQERIVLEYHLRGYTAQEISTTIRRSRRTIEGCLERIKNKLGVKKKSEVIALVNKMILLGIF